MCREAKGFHRQRGFQKCFDACDGSSPGLGSSFGTEEAVLAKRSKWKFVWKLELEVGSGSSAVGSYEG